MKINEHTGRLNPFPFPQKTNNPAENILSFLPMYPPALSSRSILLVPYSPHHVPTYHQWMQDPDLQAATASEPLSLEEEYAMQRSWRLDSDKLTFIICRPRDETTSSTTSLTTTPGSSSSSGDREKENQQEKEEKDQITATKDDSPDRMIGDINLFLFPLDSSSSPSPSPSPPSSEAIPPPPQKILGEIEIMIADKSSQRKGHGKTSLLIFLDYILEHWSLIGREFSSSSSSSASSSSDPSTSFPAAAAFVAPQLAYLRVKVHETNVGSIRLFESVGFQRVSETANYFGEIEMRWYTTDGGGGGGGHTGGEKARELPYRMEAATERS